MSLKPMANSKEPRGVPRLSPKEELIVKLLLNGEEKYGLQLVREADGGLKRGTVYVTLDRLEDKGLVESRPEKKLAGVPGIRRRLYRVSALGERALRAKEAALIVFQGGEVAL